MIGRAQFRRGTRSANVGGFLSPHPKETPLDHRSKGLSLSGAPKAKAAASLLRAPHVVVRGVYVAEAGSGTVMHAVTPRLSGTPGGLRRRVPRCGKHSGEILGELGAAAEDVAALAPRRIIRRG
jgi:hypothetical protein